MKGIVLKGRLAVVLATLLLLGLFACWAAERWLVWPDTASGRPTSLEAGDGQPVAGLQARAGLPNANGSQ